MSHIVSSEGWGSTHNVNIAAMRTLASHNNNQQALLAGLYCSKDKLTSVAASSKTEENSAILGKIDC